MVNEDFKLSNLLTICFDVFWILNGNKVNVRKYIRNEPKKEEEEMGCEI